MLILEQPIHDWTAQVLIGGGFVIALLIVLWKVGIIQPRKEAGPEGIVSELKAKLDALKMQIDHLAEKIDDHDEAKLAEVRAIRSHLHEIRGMMSPLSLAVEYLTEEIRKRG